MSNLINSLRLHLFANAATWLNLSTNTSKKQPLGARQYPIETIYLDERGDEIKKMPFYNAKWTRKRVSSFPRIVRLIGLTLNIDPSPSAEINTILSGK